MSTQATVKTAERPIIFGAHSIRAILSNSKTQTRRVIKNPDKYERIRECAFCCPYGQPGDRLWVREAWGDVTLAFQSHECEQPRVWSYRADEAVHNDGGFLEHMQDSGIVCQRWHSPLFMPQWMSRITLEITNVRVERLRDITDADAVAEGCEDPTCSGCAIAPGFMREVYLGVWDSKNAKRGYPAKDNPYVWVLEFKRLANA